MGLCGVKADWRLNTDAPALGRGGFIITDPPEQCPGEFTTFTLAGLGVGSGRYIGDGGEYGGRATGPGEAGVLTRLIGVIPPGAIITFTGLIGDLLFRALVGRFGILFSSIIQQKIQILPFVVMVHVTSEFGCGSFYWVTCGGVWALVLSTAWLGYSCRVYGSIT